jgi:hypothetical protein
MPKNRGRPPRAGAEVDADRLIAVCVERLLHWGFSGSGEVFEAVAKAAHDVIGRKSAEGGHLGPDSVKKIHQEFAPPGWERYWPDEMRAALNPFSRHRMWTKPSLRRHAPAGTVDELARLLLQHAGAWPPEQVYRGEPEPTSKWAASLDQMPRLKSRVRK